MPSPKTLAAIEEAYHTAEKNQSLRILPALNIEINMTESKDTSPGIGDTQNSLNTTQ